MQMASEREREAWGTVLRGQSQSTQQDNIDSELTCRISAFGTVVAACMRHHHMALGPGH